MANENDKSEYIDAEYDEVEKPKNQFDEEGIVDPSTVKINREMGDKYSSTWISLESPELKPKTQIIQDVETQLQPYINQYCMATGDDVAEFTELMRAKMLDAAGSNRLYLFVKEFMQMSIAKSAIITTSSISQVLEKIHQFPVESVQDVMELNLTIKVLIDNLAQLDKLVNKFQVKTETSLDRTLFERESQINYKDKTTLAILDKLKKKGK